MIFGKYLLNCSKNKITNKQGKENKMIFFKKLYYALTEAIFHIGSISEVNTVVDEDGKKTVALIRDGVRIN